MKRTLLEILCGLAVVVLLVSLHHQISRLKVQNRDVARLETMVEDAVAIVESQDDLAGQRQAMLANFASKIGILEARLRDAVANGNEANKLAKSLEATRREAETFQAEVRRDVRHAKELVDTYHREIRSVDERSKTSVAEARADFANFARNMRPDPAVLSRDMLSPAVQLNGDDTVGSGTLVFSAKSPKTRKVESYLLTSYHVVRNILADTPSARRSGVSVTFYTPSGKVEEFADMVAHDQRIDAALMKIRGTKRWATTARVLSTPEAERVRVWDPIYAVGCPLGNDPIPTAGEVASKSNVLNGCNYWMINAPTYFGNSGGGVYLAEERALVGVFSKIYTHGRGTPVVVPHMGLCTPITVIHAWLKKEKLGFVLSHEVAASTPKLASPAPGK